MKQPAYLLDPCVGIKWIKLLTQETVDESKLDTKEYILYDPLVKRLEKTNLSHRPPLVVRAWDRGREVTGMGTGQLWDDGNVPYLDQSSYVSVYSYQNSPNSKMGAYYCM